MSEPTRTNVLVDAETQRQIDDLALWWGVEQSRNFMIIVRRCVERIHAQESAKRELEEFDKAQQNESDPLHNIIVWRRFRSRETRLSAPVDNHHITYNPHPGGPGRPQKPPSWGFFIPLPRISTNLKIHS